MPVDNDIKLYNLIVDILDLDLRGLFDFTKTKEYRDVLKEGQAKIDAMAKEKTLMTRNEALAKLPLERWYGEDTKRGYILDCLVALGLIKFKEDGEGDLKRYQVKNGYDNIVSSPRPVERHALKRDLNGAIVDLETDIKQLKNILEEL